MPRGKEGERGEGEIEREREGREREREREREGERGEGEIEREREGEERERERGRERGREGGRVRVQYGLYNYNYTTQSLQPIACRRLTSFGLKGGRTSLPSSSSHVHSHGNPW